MSARSGTGRLVRFVARRERVRIPLYLLIFAALIASTAAQSEELYPTAADRAEYVATVGGNPGLIAMVGPAHDLTTVGGDTAWQWGGVGGVVVALMSMFLLGRHTRAEEQSGRSELIRASAVGREAPTAAALLTAAAANVLLGAVTALTLLAFDQPGAGSIWVLIGAAVALFGLVPRAVSLAWGLLAAAFLLGTLGPLLALPDWVMDLSPYSHVPLVPAADLEIAPLVALTAVAAALVAAGLAGFRRRDVPA